MKNVIRNLALALFWLVLFFLIISNLRFENFGIVLALSLVFAFVPILSLAIDFNQWLYEHDRWNGNISCLGYLTTLFGFVGLLYLIFFIIPKELVPIYAVLLGIIELASKKFKKHGWVISKIISIRSIIYQKNSKGGKIKTYLSYDAKKILYAFSPFKDIC